MKEVKILMKLKHPNINEIYDTEQDKRFLNIFLQLCTGGDLFTYITGSMGTGNPLCEAEAKYLMYQLLLGLRYLHDLMISHRDLKELHLISPLKCVDFNFSYTLIAGKHFIACPWAISADIDRRLWSCETKRLPGNI